jgi:hypothetical protein
MSDKTKTDSKIKTHIFPNGFRLIYEYPNNGLGITSLHTYCDFGSAHEIDEVRGGAHFIEHMCFKGTKKIPAPSDIYIKYDDVGAYLNAYTNKRHTCYIVKANELYTHNCIDMLSDMMLNSTFNKKEYEKEEPVVVEESLRSGDDAEEDLVDLADAIIYAGSSYEFPIDTLAYHKNKKFSYEKIVELYKLFYRPEKMILSVVSRIPFQKILDMVKTSFFVKTTAKYTLYKKPITENSYDKYKLYYSDITQSDIIYKLKSKANTNTIHLNVSFRVCGTFDDDKYILQMLEHILSGTFGSRLTMLLREKNGLTYTSNASTTFYEHAGDLTIYAQMDHNKIIKNGKTSGVLPLIIELLNDLLKNGVNEKELKTAKRNLNNKMFVELEDSDTQCEHNGEELLIHNDLKKIVSYGNVFDRFYSSITTKQINEIIKKFFKRDHMIITMVGDPLPTQGSLEKVCSKFI